MKNGRSKPTDSSTPATCSTALRAFSSNSFCDNLRLSLSTSAMLMPACARPVLKPSPLEPIVVDRVLTSGIAIRICSICNAFSLVRCRLEPVLMRRFRRVKPWSVCGTNSEPTSGVSMMAPTKLRKPAHITRPRGVSVAKRMRRAWLRSRLPCASKGRP